MNCSKAETKLDRLICSSAQLKKADSAMSAAYFNMLRPIEDPAIRAALINSQRRWVAAREHDLAHFGGSSDESDTSDSSQKLAIVLQITRDRTEFIDSHSGAESSFVANAQRQQKLADAYTGGPFAGYQVSCSFIPGRGNQSHYTYICFGSHSYQEGSRVCSQSDDFASYTTVTTRGVANVDDESGMLKPLATCVFGSSSDSLCPTGLSQTDKNAKWNINPTQAQLLAAFGGVSLVKLDPEFHDDAYDLDWIHACLTDPTFPHVKASMTR